MSDMISYLHSPPACRRKKHLDSLATILIQTRHTYMESSLQQKQDHIMEVPVPVPEIHGDLLMELLDASLAAENAGHQQLGSVADDVGCWIDDSQESYDIHAHHDCEDCGLDDGGGILLDFDEYGGSRSRLRSPYVVFDHDDTLEWTTETADDGAANAMDPFASECTGGWYMDGLVMAMAMEWDEEQDDAGSGGFPFGPCYGEEEAGAAEQVYASPLWE